MNFKTVIDNVEVRDSYKYLFSDELDGKFVFLG